MSKQKVNIEVNREIIPQEDESPRLVNNPTNETVGSDTFFITREMDFASLPEDSNTLAIDSYLYKFYKENTNKNRDLIYLDLLLIKNGRGYEPVNISLKQNENSKYFVTEKQMQESFLTTRYKSDIYTHKRGLILSETQNGYYLLRFNTDNEVSVLAYNASADTNETNAVVMSYYGQSVCINECSPNKFYYDNTNINSYIKYGYFWKFDENGRCFIPAVLDYTIDEWQVEQRENDNSFKAEEVKTNLQNIKIYPLYYNRAVTISKLTDSYNYGTPKDSNGNAVECNGEDCYKYNYYTTDITKTVLEMREDVPIGDFMVVRDYLSDISQFKFTVQPNWTSDNNGVPVALEVSAQLYTSENDEPVDDIVFLCTKGKDGVAKIEENPESIDFSDPRNQTPLEKKDKFVIQCDKFDRETVSIAKLTVTPVMIFGKLDDMSREFIIDCTKIMSGECDFTNWAYFIDNEVGEVSLTHGLNLYLSDTMYVSEAYIQFYDVEKFSKEDGTVVLPQSFYNEKPQYTLDIHDKVSSSGIYQEEIQMSDDTIQANKLYICRTVVGVKVGVTKLVHTRFRYMFTDSSFNTYYTSVSDFDEKYLNFHDYAQVVIKSNVSYKDEEFPKYVGELYTTVQRESQDEKEYTLEEKHIELVNDINVYSINNNESWSFDNPFSVSNKLSFVSSTGNEVNNKTITVHFKQEKVSDTSIIQPNYLFESVLSYLCRNYNDETIENYWGIDTSFNMKNAMLIGMVQHNYTITSRTFCTYGNAKIKNGNLVNIEQDSGYIKHVTNDDKPMAFYVYDVIKQWNNYHNSEPQCCKFSITLGSQPNSQNRQAYAKGTDYFYEGDYQRMSISYTTSYHETDTQKTIIDDEFLKGQLIFIINKTAYQSGIFYFMGKTRNYFQLCNVSAPFERSGNEIKLLGDFRDEIIMSSSDIGNMLATKLSQYYIYSKVENVSAPTEVFSGEWYKNTYNAKNIDIKIKNVVSIVKDQEEISHDDNWYYFDFNGLVKYNNTYLYSLDDQMCKHGEVRSCSNNLKFEPLGDNSNYNYKAKNISGNIDFINSLNDFDEKRDDVMMTIAPNGEVKFYGQDKEDLARFVKDGTTFVWPYYSDSFKQLNKQEEYNDDFCMIGKIEKLNNTYTYIGDSPKGVYHLQPQFDYLDKNNYFLPNTWYAVNDTYCNKWKTYNIPGRCTIDIRGIANPQSYNWF